jgi:hypothetical protein
MTTPPEQPTTTTDDQMVADVLRPKDFSWGAVATLPGEPGERVLAAFTGPPLGPLENFTSPVGRTFHGNGFNTIFRPQSPATPTQLPTPVPDSDNVLELNLTEETLSFSPPIVTDTVGIPNRGEVQGDIFLNAVPYLQVINDLTFGQANKVGIHFEPGVWVIVPDTTDPDEPGTSAGKRQQTLVRMGSIPHGTTINAQGTFSSASGPPSIPPVNAANIPASSGPPSGITPFKTGSQPPQLVRFPSQTDENSGTARIPQDLTSFIAAGTITQALLDDPNKLLRDVVAKQSGPNTSQTISSTITISIATNPATPLFGGGADNIAFLLGDPSALTLAHEQQQGLISAPPPGPGPNAQALSMQATFWIETVNSKIVVPAGSTGGQTLTLQPEPLIRKQWPHVKSLQKGGVRSTCAPIRKLEPGPAGRRTRTCGRRPVRSADRALARRAPAVLEWNTTWRRQCANRHNN